MFSKPYSDSGSLTKLSSKYEPNVTCSENYQSRKTTNAYTRPTTTITLTRHVFAMKILDTTEKLQRYSEVFLLVEVRCQVILSHIATCAKLQHLVHKPFQIVNRRSEEVHYVWMTQTSEYFHFVVKLRQIDSIVTSSQLFDVHNLEWGYTHTHTHIVHQKTTFYSMLSIILHTLPACLQLSYPCMCP